MDPLPCCPYCPTRLAPEKHVASAREVESPILAAIANLRSTPKASLLAVRRAHMLVLADAKDADDLVELVGDYTARSFYSRVWQLREAALMRMQRLLEVGILP